MLLSWCVRRGVAAAAASRPSSLVLPAASLSSRPPGTEPWNPPSTVPGSSGRAYKWASKNKRIHLPVAETPEEMLVKDEQGNVLPVSVETA